MAQQITILGSTPAKKNARRPYVRAGRIMNFPSKKYVEWEKDALKQIMSHPKEQLDGVTIFYTFYCNNVKRDLDNMIASINDMLVKAGIIKDDAWQCLTIGGAKGELDRKNPRAEITIIKD